MGEGEGKERLAMVSSGMVVRHCWGRMSRHPLDIVRSGCDVVLLHKEGDKGVVFEEEVGTVLQSEGPLLRGEEFASDVKGALHGREEGGVVGHCKEYSTLSKDPTSGWQACSAVWSSGNREGYRSKCNMSISTPPPHPTHSQPPCVGLPCAFLPA